MNNPNSTPASYTKLRLGATAAGSWLTFLSSLSAYNLWGNGPFTIENVFLLLPTTLALMCWWVAFGIHLTESRRRMKHALRGAVMLGSAGLLVGGIGPLILGLILGIDANTGPLIGILITGPLGALVGGIGGYIYASVQSSTTRTRFFIFGTVFFVCILAWSAVHIGKNSWSADQNTEYFTAVYDRVGLLSSGLGGRLLSISPNTEYLHKEMFRKVVHFIPNKNGHGTQFIGIDRPRLTAGEESILLPEYQKLRIKGYYNKTQHRPYAEVVELVN